MRTWALVLFWLVLLAIPAFPAQGERAIAVPHQGGSRAKSVAATSRPAGPGSADVPEVKGQTIVTNYGKLPLSFEMNQGQMDAHVKFVSRGGGYMLFLTSDEAVLALRKKNTSNRSQIESQNQKTENRKDEARPVSGKSRFDAQPSPFVTDYSPIDTEILRMRPVGAKPASKVGGEEELPGKVNYFIGSDPKRWRRNIPTYAKVRYEGVYPGVDLVYYGDQWQLEYDFAVAPGADPNQIALGIEPSVAPVSSPAETTATGTSPLEIAANGDLVIHIDGADEVRLHKPRVYQPDAGSSLGSGHPSLIDCSYVLTASDQVRFALGPYDHSKPLVIDPVLLYSSYLGGSNDDEAYSVAVDRSGDAYLTGVTVSTDFPIANPVQASNHGGSDAFVAKINAAGSALIYSTYLGGSGRDVALSVALGSAGDAYVAGETTSGDFPVTPGAFQTTFGGGTVRGDGFVTTLTADGSALIYSTYIGGSMDDTVTSIAVDSVGNAYLTGRTNSTNFPVTTGSYQTAYAGGTTCGDAFVAKLNANGTALVYSTYLGGSGDDKALGLVIDSVGNAYVVGFTDSSNFPVTAGAFQGAFAGGSRVDASCSFVTAGDAFVTKLNAAGNALGYSTYLGGAGLDAGRSIALDQAGDAYVAGYTLSANFPVTPGAFQSTLAGGSNYGDAFVAKLNPSGSALLSSTYLGGTQDEVAFSLALDAASNVYVTGFTLSTSFPVTSGAFQPSYGGGGGPSGGAALYGDAYFTELDPNASRLISSSYLGGSMDDVGYRIAVDRFGKSYIVGSTVSPNFPTTVGALDTTCGTDEKCNGGAFPDAFVTKIAPLAANLGVELTGSPNPVTSGSNLTYTIVASNDGPDSATSVRVSDSIPPGTTFVSARSTAGTCSTPPVGSSTGKVSCAEAMLAAGGSFTVTMVVDVTALGGSSVTDIATVSSKTFDPNLHNNSAKVVTNVI